MTARQDRAAGNAKWLRALLREREPRLAAVLDAAAADFRCGPGCTAHAPRMTEPCPHRYRLPLCDECASVPRMSRWAMTLTGAQLAGALDVLAENRHWYTSAEQLAVLAEAARRISETGDGS
jgi:hypothetical protein